MRRGKAEFLTDLRRVEAEVLAHEEYPRGARRQPLEAGLEGREELLFVELALGIRPWRGVRAPMAALVEERVERRLVRLIAEGHLAPAAAQGIDDLVLEDPGEPGAQVRAPLEARSARERSEQCFLDRVLGRVAVAQRERGIAQQVGAQRFELGAEVGGVAGQF